MARFTGTYVNKVDRKGRVSLPAPFRSALEQTGGAVFFLKPSADRRALDGVTERYMDDVQRRLDALDLYSPEREALELREFGETVQVQVDGEGRFVLPKMLGELVGLDETITFVGLGTRFQLWEPEAQRSRSEALLAQSRGMAIGRPDGPSAGGSK